LEGLDSLIYLNITICPACSSNQYMIVRAQAEVSVSTRRNEKSTSHQQSGGDGMRLFRFSSRACFAPTHKNFNEKGSTISFSYWSSMVLTLP
jgi:hypothetical protein